MAQIENTISGVQLLEEWYLDPAELSYNILKHDLTVLKPSRIPVLGRFLPPQRLGSDSRQLLHVIKDDSEGLYRMLFLLEEVQKIPKKPAPGPSPQYYTPMGKGSKPSIKDHPEPEEAVVSCEMSLLNEVIEEHENPIKENPNVFSLLGRVWFVKFAKEELGLYPDQEKYRYIAHVLGLCNGYPRPSDTEYSIYNTDLCAKVKGDPGGNNLAAADSSALKDLSEADLSNSDLSDKLSVEDIGKFREMGHDLLEQLEDAREALNTDRIKKALDNIEAYRSHLSNEYGIIAVISKDENKIYFKVRYRPSKELEKLRQLVKNQINKAIKDFDTMPRFKSHLQHSVKMKSNKTIYSPELPTAWYVSM